MRRSGRAGHSRGHLNENEHTLLFVVGVMRSGTSLLYSLLNQHSQIGLMYESNILCMPLCLSRTPETRWLRRAELWNKSLSRHFGKDWPETLPPVGGARDLYRAYASPKGARVCGEKSPAYCTKLEWIARKFPDARFILLRRDLAEIYRSVRDAGRTDRWFARRGTFCRMIRQQDALARGARALERRGAQVHPLDYGSLVADTEGTMRGVCRFLGLDFEERMASLSGADFSPVFHAPHHQHLRGVDIKRREKPVMEDSPLRERLGRFQARSNRLSGDVKQGAASREPSLAERTLFQTAGAFFLAMDEIVRWIYEAAPEALLTRYRTLRS